MRTGKYRSAFRTMTRWLFGRCILFEDMMRSLDQHIGPGRHFLVEERQSLLPDCFLYYFVALADAQAFVDRFSGGVWIAGEWRHGQKAATGESDMSWVGRPRHRLSVHGGAASRRRGRDRDAAPAAGGLSAGVCRALCHPSLSRDRRASDPPPRARAPRVPQGRIARCRLPALSPAPISGWCR